MSAKTMGQVWDLDIPHNQLLVLLAMTDHADHSGGNIYPSIGLIAHKTGYSERQVKRVIKSLVSAGILVLEKIGNGTVNVYRVDFSNAKKKEPYKTRDKMSPPQEKTHDKMSQGVGHSYVTGGGDIAMSPEPSLEPSINLSDDSKVIAMPQAAMEEPTDTSGKSSKKPNPWYDVVQEVLNLTGSLNVEYQKFLRGMATSKKYKPYNLEKPLENPDDLRAWSKWYRKTVLNGNPKLNMVTSPAKIQSSVTYWQSLEIQPAPVVATQDAAELAQAHLLKILKGA